MRFWDSSAIVPLILVESSSDRMDVLVAEDDLIAAWWATPVECLSGIGRRDREGSIDATEAAVAVTKLDLLAERWVEVPPTSAVRERARRLVRTHDLRAADALQLAAALGVVGDTEGALPFVTLDERLAVAAGREGFPVLGLV